MVFALMLVTPIFFVSAVRCIDGTYQTVCPNGVDNTGNNTAGSNNTGNNTAGIDNTGTNINVKIENPLGPKGPQTIPDFIKKLIEVVLVVGVPIAALAIIYTGFLFVQAQGNSEKLTKAKNALLYTLIGTALLLGAFVIANAIGKTVKDISSGV